MAYDSDGNIVRERKLKKGERAWPTMDRFAEKYYSTSPYAYVANNPVKYIDPNGDTISVADHSREQFMSDMRNVFGDQTDNFVVNNNGTLDFTGNRRDLTRDQRSILRGMNTLMSSNTNYTVSYGSTYTTQSGQTINVDGPDAGGAMYHAVDNVIVVSPNIQGGNVITVEPFGQATIEMNTTLGLFHEMGEALQGTNEYRSGAVDFENRARSATNMPARPYDIYHQPRPRTPTPPMP
jgi:hypothetical protein